MALPNRDTALDNVELSTEQLFQAQAHVWNHMLTFINSVSLKCAVQLGIPDIIHNHGKPITLSQLAQSLSISESKSQCVHRLMRVLVHSKFFIEISNPNEKEEETRYWLTPASHFLLRDSLFTVVPFVKFIFDPINTKPWNHIIEWLVDNHTVTPSETAHDVMIWEIVEREPRLGCLFNEAMASDSRLVARGLLKDFKHVFEGVKSLVDVAGGTGTMGKAIANAFPSMKCIVLDLPHVVVGLEGSDNLTYVGGDMFETIPPADAVLLKWILHDWNDEECLKILKKCKDAIPSKNKGGKVMIIDMVVDIDQGDDKATKYQLFLDMVMMAYRSGKERSEKEWANIFSKAGFTGYKITPAFGARSLIEWILHDWNDEESLKILKKCKDAIPSKNEGGKVLIIDMVVDIDHGDDEATKDQLVFDMALMAFFSGKERSEKEWAILFSEAGFTGYNITSAFGVRSLIEVYP